jgi:hypothetical protein
MIKSAFILNILDLLLDGDKEGKAIRPQIEYLTESEYDYTGVGLFLNFQKTEEILNYKYPEDRVILDGVTITSPEIKIGASAILFLNSGIIDYLEIWSYDGEYPRKELTSYVLKQEGTYTTGRQITVDGPPNMF